MSWSEGQERMTGVRRREGVVFRHRGNGWSFEREVRGRKDTEVAGGLEVDKVRRKEICGHDTVLLSGTGLYCGVCTGSPEV